MITVTAQQLQIFAGILVPAILSPGPAVIAASQSAFALGRARTLPYAWGLAFGASLWCVVSLLGLTIIFQTLPWTYTALSVLGGLYLLWIAWKMWRHAPDPLPDPAEGTGGISFWGGVTLNLSNPKPALFYSSVLLSVFPLSLTILDKTAIYATAVSVEMIFYTAVACLMALPWPRRRYYASKFWIDRGAGLLIGLLGLTLILRH